MADDDENKGKPEPEPDRNLEPIRGDIRLTFPVMTEDGITDAGVTILASNGRVHFWDSFNTDNPKHWEALAGCSPALAKLVRRVLESDARLVHIRREALVAKEALDRLIQVAEGKAAPRP